MTSTRAIVLDTNALLWTLGDDPRLGATTRRLLGGDRRVYFSAVSVLECTIKQMRGRLQLPGDLTDAAKQAGLVELPFRAAHARSLQEFTELARHDPFDRMLLAQQHCEKLALLTSDAVLLGLGIDDVLDASS